MKKLLVDTDILIDCLRQPRKKTLFKNLISKKKYKISIATVTITELWRGKSIERKKERMKVNRLLKKVGVCFTNEKISKKAGELLRNYSHLMLADSLVSATAIINRCSLVTFNQKHFEKIKKLSVFQIKF